MSIRLRPGGFSFSIYNPSESQSFVFRDVAFDGKMPYIALLQQCFSANEYLVWPYKRIRALWVSPQYTLAPKAWLPDERKRQLLSFTFSAPEKRCLSDRADDSEVVYGMPEEVYEFCSRSLTRPLFTHHITPQLKIFGRQSRIDTFRRMCVVLHDRLADITCFSAGKILFANSFKYEQWSDCLYFILYVWRQTGMNRLEDRLFLAGETPVCNRLAKSLRTYIRNVGRVEIPVKAYLIGGEILRAPMDLILLSSCE
jgi:hypothetical protein